jgi:hypothetical protein
MAQQQQEVSLLAQVKRTRAAAFNVTAKINGRDATLAPLIVMTPRSAWYACASERGGGIACWLELMRSLRSAPPARDVLFVASSGHELGHLGIDIFVGNRPGIVSKAIGWIHLGANIGAATQSGAITQSLDDDPARRHALAAAGSGNTTQASDDQFEGILSDALTTVGLTISRRVPRGTIPGGEAETVHRGGGRYVSVIGSNALFHNPDDRAEDGGFRSCQPIHESVRNGRTDADSHVNLRDSLLLPVIQKVRMPLANPKPFTWSGWYEVGRVPLICSRVTPQRSRSTWTNSRYPVQVNSCGGATPIYGFAVIRPLTAGS